MQEWFSANAGWFGPLVAIILAVIGWRLQVLLKTRRAEPQIRQRQRGGDRSTNIQVAGDVSSERSPDERR